MGRTAKRVPMDFKYTKDKIWHGYINPFIVPCPEGCTPTDEDDPDVPMDCSTCYGTGRDVQDIDPPEGEGWQMWETTSEGSPQTPVFATLQELAEYCAINCSTFGTTNFVSAADWERMLGDDFVYHREGNITYI